MSSERELIKLAISGDEGALDTLIKQCGEQIYSLAFRLTNNPRDAEDLWQDAFIKAYKGISKFNHDCSFATWVYRIAINIWKDKSRYEKTRSFLRALSLDKLIETENGALNKEIPDTESDPAVEMGDSRDK